MQIKTLTIRELFIWEQIVTWDNNTTLVMIEVPIFYPILLFFTAGEKGEENSKIGEGLVLQP